MKVVCNTQVALASQYYNDRNYSRGDFTGFG